VEIFDSKIQAKKIEDEIKQIITLHNRFVEKVLAIVLIGDDPASEKFIQIKVSLCEKLGLNCKVFNINDKEMSDEEVFSEIEKVFSSDEVGGGIVQLPLPRKSLYKVLDLIPVDKDVDVISTEGKRRYYSGDFSCLPPVVRAIKNYFDNCGINLEGLRSVVVGDGELVGKTLAFYLSKKGSDVEVISNYEDQKKIDCDLLILSAGVPNLVRGENISRGCNVVDFGSSVVDGKCVGDLDMTSSLEHLGCVSKSPGGMGPLVVRYLLLNFLDKI
jgi:methylenetetrahydrofolate dehydrogenase (NADP+)/methenyltetrahydrofolate cyclohydrolase